MRALVVERAGPLTLVQDGGRPGHGGIGVPPSGALDPLALADAGRLVGDDPGTAGLEVLLGGLRVRAGAPLRVAVTGAAGPLTLTPRGGRPVPAPWSAALDLRTGDALDVGVAVAGLRYYLAVAGGLDVPAVLGSRSTDTLSGLGPPPVCDGDVLPVGAPGRRPGAALAPVDWLPVSAPPAGEVVLRVGPGPRADRLAPGAWPALLARRWRVSTRSDRVGLRLDGEPLERATAAELPSEGLVTGALQVPPSGCPVLFLADHPTTGGYPVVAVVVRDDVRRAAQLRPGQAVRFGPAPALPARTRRRRAAGQSWSRTSPSPVSS